MASAITGIPVTYRRTAGDRLSIVSAGHSAIWEEGVMDRWRSKRTKVVALTVALVAGLAVSSATLAQAMSRNQFKASRSELETNYKAERQNCASRSGPAHDLCIAEAEGNDKIARAELDQRYKPSARNRFSVALARADAAYAVAKVHCDEQEGNARDVCQKQAKADEVTAKTNAKAQMTEQSAIAEAREKAAEARREANKDKRAAELALAREKCDSNADAAKDKCLDAAERRFGRR